MKIVIRNKEYIERVIRTGCYYLRHYGRIDWKGQPITSESEFKEIVKKFFRKHLHTNNNRILILTPDIKAKHLCKIIDNY